MRIKSLPEEERPLEKLVGSGQKTLSNAELLALIIHTGMPGGSAIRLAEDVLSVCSRGLSDLGAIELEELTEIPGIGKGKAAAVLAAIELGKRIATSPGTRRLSASSADEVAGLFMETLRYEKKEHFKSVMVNSRGDVISIDDVSVGELSSAVVHPREVFRQAVRRSAAGLIFVHNHPSGDPTPSEEDILTTKRLIAGGEVLGIRVLDHIVIGDGAYASLRGMGLIEQ
ncbi:hypothetical protein BHK98_04795 [Hornefia porci]|uniref:MPN domain-containing protein n=1 Tax=Hornefia porci TaxID=2652292 RepID=A0A1Q9JGX3_9FIRM|nr:DNA repair protein RadC [Hornefia porci]OLR55439.1 hypothetical protein BHK98_04795 [Hornefia porci]